MSRNTLQRKAGPATAMFNQCCQGVNANGAESRPDNERLPILLPGIHIKAHSTLQNTGGVEAPSVISFYVCMTSANMDDDQS